MHNTFGLLLSDELMFNSRITGTARDLGLQIKPVRTQAELEKTATRRQLPACVILDLANAGLDIAGLMSSLRANCSPMPFVVAYGSHVDTATLKKARQEGCDLVLPRSKFVEDLPTALPTWFAAGNKEQS